MSQRRTHIGLGVGDTVPAFDAHEAPTREGPAVSPAPSPRVILFAALQTALTRVFDELSDDEARELLDVVSAWPDATGEERAAVASIVVRLS